jgi:hypothetical protein
MPVRTTADLLDDKADFDTYRLLGSIVRRNEMDNS